MERIDDTTNFEFVDNKLIVKGVADYTVPVLTAFISIILVGFGSFLAIIPFLIFILSVLSYNKTYFDVGKSQVYSAEYFLKLAYLKTQNVDFKEIDKIVIKGRLSDLDGEANLYKPLRYDYYVSSKDKLIKLHLSVESLQTVQYINSLIEDLGVRIKVEIDEVDIKESKEKWYGS